MQTDEGEASRALGREERLLSEIVELKQVIARLRMSEERARLTVETAYDACISIDADGVVTDWNLQAEATFGWSRSDVVGKVLADLIIPSQFREMHRKGMERFLATGEGPVLNKRVEMIALHKDGHEFPVELRIAPIHWGKTYAFSAFVHDITNRKVAEERLKAFTAKLEQSNRELQDFAFVASHDLQEPLRKVTSFGDLLKIKYGRHLPAEGHDYLERMVNAVKRMQVLITDLLTYSQVITQVQPFSWVDLKSVAQEVLSDLDQKIREADGRVEVGDLPAIEAEPVMIYQLFQNLVSNAIKYRRQGVPPIIKINGAILPGDRQLSAGEAASPAVPSIQITVEDNGIGFDEKHLDRMFIIFKRLHGRSSYAGSGIGLAICKKVVDHHKGSITAKSKLNEGSTFIAILPTQQAKGEEI